MESVPYVTRWLQTHPERRPDSPLFVNYGKYKGTRATKEGIYKLMQRLTERLNNGKRIYSPPHLFRHSRATELANHLTEAQMNKFFGWATNSGMPSVYVHLSGRDINNAILKVYGLEKNGEDKKPETLAPKLCPRCKEKAFPRIPFA